MPKLKLNSTKCEMRGNMIEKNYKIICAFLALPKSTLFPSYRKIYEMAKDDPALFVKTIDEGILATHNQKVF